MSTEKHNTIKPVNNDQGNGHSGRGRLIPWIPILIILVVAVLFGIGFLLGGLYRVFTWNLFKLVLPALGLITLISTVINALVKRRVNKNILLTGFASLLCLLAAIPNFVPVAYPASITSTKPSATVRLPANVPLKVGWGGDTYAVNYHVVAPDQRWAYDLLIDPYLNGSANLEDYGCYGVPIVAPAAGTVTMVHDGEPDMVPGKDSMNAKAPAGNFIAIRLKDTGTYLLLAHIKPGSFQVAAGEEVKEGQVIGQCGNSGNTSEPHIHIHHQRQDPALYPNGFSEGLPLYFRDSDGPPMPEGGGYVDENGIPIANGPTVKHIGK